MSSVVEHLPAVGFVAVPLLGSLINSRITRSNMREWYEKLKFPWFRPPNWVFAPVWTTIYTCMGVSSYLIWREGGFEQQALPLAIYGGQVLLNAAWSPIFFGQHRIGLVRLVACLNM